MSPPQLRPDQADAIKNCSDRQLRGQIAHLEALWHVWSSNVMETAGVLAVMKEEMRRRAKSGKVRTEGI
jgi:hypothetical protein